MLLAEVNENLKNDFKYVDKIRPQLIETIIKSKLKSNKTDPEFDLMTDGFKNGPKEHFAHISVLLRIMLIHGHISALLLVCAILPLIKKKNGKTDDSDNYRGIGLSSLFLKIYDWVVLLLFEQELKSDDN